jgi:hypothetical protein
MPGQTPNNAPEPLPRPRELLAHMRTLVDTRSKAAKNPNDYPLYSQAALERMDQEFTRRDNGHILYNWQRDVGEALLLGLDCTVIAGTNAGKTTPTILPLLAAPPGERRVLLMLSPLKLLQVEQVSPRAKLSELWSSLGDSASAS